MQTSLPDIEPLSAPSWCFNSHVHTVARSLFSYPEKPPFNRIEIPTSDEDFLELDVMDAGNNRPVIALFHGLEGSTDRYYIIELMQAFSELNYSVVAVNFRGCGSRMNKKRRFYHSGATNDLMTVFKWIKKRFPNSSMGAVGFSLGGNVLLKSLGEEGTCHPLQAAVAVSVPYELKKGSLHLNQGFNKIYQHLFLQSLRQKLEEKKTLYPDLPTFSGSTLYAFDDQITGPVHGFQDAEDYYGQCSSASFVQNISKPTLLIHSKEDSLCPVSTIPIQKIKSNINLDYLFTEEGGHVGFWSRPQGWLNRTIIQYIQHTLG